MRGFVDKIETRCVCDVKETLKEGYHESQTYFNRSHYRHHHIGFFCTGCLGWLPRTTPFGRLRHRHRGPDTDQSDYRSASIHGRSVCPACGSIHPSPSPAIRLLGHSKEWVAAEYKRVWNPGHYGRHGAWINGHWKRIEVSPGHWAKKRVWVAYR